MQNYYKNITFTLFSVPKTLFSVLWNVLSDHLTFLSMEMNELYRHDLYIEKLYFSFSCLSSLFSSFTF